VGVFSFARGETQLLVARGSGGIGSLAPGGHELTLHFTRGLHAGDEPLAEIDWVHIGTGDSSEPYPAPTHADAVVDETLGGRSIRAMSLRAPGFVRCAGWIPANATLEASLATVGGPDAEVEARIVQDRRPPVVLGTATVAGGATGWLPWSVPVTGLSGDGALASVEIVVRRAAKGARVLIGAPRVMAAGPVVALTPPAAHNVVLVILGSTSAKALAPWGGPHAVPELAALASAGSTFLAQRASSSLANAVVASMLTGLSPIEHGLVDESARLPDDVTTVQEACRQGSVLTAMFTANPTTGPAFGFGRGWDTFVDADPLDDAPATRVFDEAAAWIDAHKAARFFVVVHARGGHPPWDATTDELRAMPPDGYLGLIEPRRAAEAMAKARKHPGRFKEDDRVRAWALYDRAIDEHDEALGRLVAALRTDGRAEDTAIIVTADVAASESAIPFGEPESLEEPILATPLVVRWPVGTSLGGQRVEAPTSSVDLARTILDVLGLPPPSAFEGEDLAALAQGTAASVERPFLATRGGRFSVRWGPYVLVGSHDRELRMCDLSLDPSCVADVRGTSALALEAIRRWALEALAPKGPHSERVPAAIDQHTAAALVRWGRLSDDREGVDDF
jgi:hypothetical protein